MDSYETETIISSPQTNCPICEAGCYEVRVGLRWCPKCGTLLHPNGAAWFCDGNYSTPYLVETVREQEERFDESHNTVREYCGLPRKVVTDE